MDDNYCVVCGAVIPEGTLVCPACEKLTAHKNLYAPVNERLSFIKSCKCESRVKIRVKRSNTNKMHA